MSRETRPYAERAEWILRPPSRRLRKLYKELAALDSEIELARQKPYCPEHAPTDWTMRRAALKELQDQRASLISRIDGIQNDIRGVL